MLGASGSIRVMDKSPDAFRTISEVADDLDLPQHVLRFWETRFAQIKPLKRGGGRRYYRPDDIDLLKGIRHLLYGQGYTIRGVQRILKSDGVRFVQSIGRGELNVEAAPAGDHADGDEPPRHEVAEPSDPSEDAPEDLLEARIAPIEVAPSRATKEAHSNGGRLTADQASALAAALDELLECERVLATLTHIDPDMVPGEFG